MAAPTPTTWTEWNGTRGMAMWDAVWSTADNFTDQVIVDISGLGAPVPGAVKIIGVYVSINGDITATLEFDATTDQLIYAFRNQTDSALRESIDFREGPNGGRSPDRSAAGFTGDIMVTTTNVASGDELTLLIWFERK